MYLLYKLPEVALICIFVSSHDKNRLYVILPRVRNWFVISSFILFLYFVLVYFNILPYIHRFIAFNSDRFGGLVGEPRDFGLLSFVFLMSTFAFPDKNSIWQRGILAVFVVSSGSNAVVLLILALLWYYIFSMKPKATLVLSVFIFFSLYGVISTIDFKIGRFDLDASELVNIATSFNPNNPPPALNPITVRFFNFVFNLYWMSKGWFSYGIGSSMDIAYNQQLFDYNVYESSTGLFGFTTIGVELGLVGLAIVLISAFSFQVKVHHLGWLSLLSFSILIVILLLSSPYSAFYLFLLLYVYKIGLNEKVLKGRFQ